MRAVSTRCWFVGPLLFACATLVACAANDSGTLVPSKLLPDAAPDDRGPPPDVASDPVSYTHLTLPTNREV